MNGPSESYEVHIGAFEGPMDLLLYLVQKNELAPKDISLAQIADQYLKWLNSVPDMDLSDAGEFLVMAARLMALKVRELLPKDQQSEVELMEFDQDRERLIAQMLEYQQFKQIAGTLQSKESENLGAFYRGRIERARTEDESLAEVGIWQLFKAFQKSLVEQGREPTHFIELDDVTIEDRQQHISNYLVRNGRALFEDLMGRDTRPLVSVVTFMAIMEMVKTEDVVLRQSEPKGAMWIYRRKNNTSFADEMAREALFHSSDPQLAPGLVEVLRAREARKAEQSQVSLDAVMRSVLAKVQSGEQVTDQVLQDLLEGKAETSEVSIEIEKPVSDPGSDS